MTHNPCKKCSKVNEDKNNSVCRKCEKRLLYVTHLEQAFGSPAAGTNSDAFVQLPFPTLMVSWSKFN
jgi:hypothetical protein